MKHKKQNSGSLNWKIIAGIIGILLLTALIRFGINISYFQITNIEINGVQSDTPLQYADKEKLLEAVKPHLSGSYFHIDLDAAQAAALETEWVSDVKIEKILPDTVRLTVKEHQPVARWVREGHVAGLVDEEGKIFQADFLNDKLPEFDGEARVMPQMAVQYQNFAAELKPLSLSILRLQYTPRASWQMMLDNGVEVRLGKQDINTRMARFMVAWQSVLNGQSDLDYVDMRYSDGFATRGGTHPQAPDENNKNSNSQINRDE